MEEEIHSPLKMFLNVHLRQIWTGLNKSNQVGIFQSSLFSCSGRIMTKRGDFLLKGQFLPDLTESKIWILILASYKHLVHFCTDYCGLCFPSLTLWRDLLKAVRTKRNDYSWQNTFQCSYVHLNIVLTQSNFNVLCKP